MTPPGRAKIDTPTIMPMPVIILPGVESGATSPYPTVVKVTKVNHSELATVLKPSLYGASIKYTRKAMMKSQTRQK